MDAVVGKVFQGQKVLNVKESTKELADGRIKSRKEIELDNGMIVIQESINAAKVDFNDSTISIEPEKLLDIANPFIGQLDGIGEDKNDKPKKRKQKKKKRTSVVEDDDPVPWILPKQALVYSKAKMNEKGPPPPGEPKCVWTYPEGVPKEHDDTDWRPQEVNLFHLDDKPENKENLPHGVWGIKPGVKSLQDSQVWDQEPELCLYPPNVKPPNESEIRGYWIFFPDSLNIKWPPPTEEPKPKLREVGKLPKKIAKPPPPPPEPVMVYNKLKYPKSLNKNKTTGMWKFPKSEEIPQDFDRWKPTEVVMYAPGADPENLDDDLPRGVWGVPKNQESSYGNETNIDDNWKPQEAFFYGPGMTPPDDVEVKGVWSYPPRTPKLKRRWPPETEPFVPKQNDVGQLPKKVSDPPSSPQPLKAYNKFKPQTKAETKPPLNRKPYKASIAPKSKVNELDNWKPQGLWHYPDATDQPKNMDNWKVQDAWIYPPGEELPKDVDKSKPHGVWCYPKRKKPVDPDANDDAWIPEQAIVFPPGVVPPDDWVVQGEWIYDSDEQFPPKPELNRKPYKASIAPESKVNELDNWKPQGLWHYPDATDQPKNMDNWKVQDVWVYPPGEELPKDADKSKPHGVWCYPKRKKPVDPDANDDAWIPEQAIVFPPGVVPPDDWVVQGEWIYDNEEEFPPSADEVDNDQPLEVTVYPKATLPEKADNNCKNGQWAYPEGEEGDDDDWQKQKVHLFPPGKEPAEIDKSRPWGYWSYPRKKKPNDDDWQPEDALIFPPGMEIGEEYDPKGIWTYPPNQLNAEWPPPKDETPKTPKQVGKLKIPEFSQKTQETPTGKPGKIGKVWSPRNDETPKSNRQVGKLKPITPDKKETEPTLREVGKLKPSTPKNKETEPPTREVGKLNKQTTTTTPKKEKSPITTTTSTPKRESLKSPIEAPPLFQDDEPNRKVTDNSKLPIVSDKTHRSNTYGDEGISSSSSQGEKFPCSPGTYAKGKATKTTVKGPEDGQRIDEELKTPEGKKKRISQLSEWKSPLAM